MMGSIRSLSKMTAVAGLFFVGCATFEPRPDPSRFYTLSSLSQAEQAPGRNPTQLAKLYLGIGPIKFPGYLDRQEIVVRGGQNRLIVSETERWAEPLQENFSRVLSENLTLLLNTERVATYPWAPSLRPRYHVEIEVLRLEATTERAAQLLARWSVHDGVEKKIISVNETQVTREAKEKSTDGAVAAMSEAVGVLSREIATAVGAIGGRLTNSPGR